MDLLHAHAVLGVEPTTPLDEVRQRYRMRAQMLHPDRQAGRPEMLAESQRAMAELNEAWETLARADQSGERTSFTAGADTGAATAREAPLREPYEGECDLCGSFPARRLTLKSTVGLLLVRRDALLQPDLCRHCGLSLFRQIQASTLTTGWWGITAFFVNIGNVFGNLSQIRKHQGSLGPPEARDPLVYSPLPPGLPPTAPVIQRSGPVLSTLAAAGLALVLAVGVAGPQLVSPESGAETSESEGTYEPGEQSAVIGLCLDPDGAPVGCGSYLAAWQITRQVDSEYYCGFSETPFETSEGLIYCARELG